MELKEALSATTPSLEGDTLQDYLLFVAKYAATQGWDSEQTEAFVAECRDEWESHHERTAIQWADGCVPDGIEWIEEP
jgi:hypothetical protein